jgi:hypothetical protein
VKQTKKRDQKVQNKTLLVLGSATPKPSTVQASMSLKSKPVQIDSEEESHKVDDSIPSEWSDSETSFYAEGSET